MAEVALAAMPCPRCSAHIEAGTVVCPQCGQEPTVGERAEFERGKRAFRRKSWAMVCKVYMGIGLCSVLAGVLLLFGPSLLLGKIAARPDSSLNVIAAILIGFGVLRIANAAFQLRRLRSPRPLPPGAHG